jgi:signal peptidase II
MKRYLVFGIVLVLALVLDQITKVWAEDSLQGCRVNKAAEGGEVEIARCHDRGVVVRLARPATRLGLVSGEGFEWTLSCEGRAECLRDRVRLGDAPDGTRATGVVPERLAPGATYTVTAQLAGRASSLEFTYERRPREVIGGFFDLSFESNPGAAFSFLADAKNLRTPILTAIAVAASLLILWMAWKLKPGQHLLSVGLALVLSGAVGNLIDRVRFSYVIDFILWHIGDKFYWPTFNIADAAIVVGVGLLVIDSVRAWLRERRARKLKKA